MLFEDTDEIMYNEGLIANDVENYKPINKPQTHEEQALRQAAMGFVRTNKGFEVRSGQSVSSTVPSSDRDGEVYTGNDGMDTAISDWTPISSSDIYNLRRLGVNI